MSDTPSPIKRQSVRTRMPSELTSTEVERQTSIPVKRQESLIPVERQTSTPGSELITSTEVERQTSIPVEKDTTIPAQRGTDIPASQQASLPAEKQAGKLVKASYYITEDHDWKLEQIRIKRRRKGVKIDKSALVREAIDLLQE